MLTINVNQSYEGTSISNVCQRAREKLMFRSVPPKCSNSVHEKYLRKQLRKFLQAACLSYFKLPPTRVPWFAWLGFRSATLPNIEMEFDMSAITPGQVKKLTPSPWSWANHLLPPEESTLAAYVLHCHTIFKISWRLRIIVLSEITLIPKGVTQWTSSSCNVFYHP